MLAICLLSALAAPDLPRPTPQQVQWANYEVGMFVHFAPNTWQDREYDDLSTPLSKINPEKLDTDQWAKTAKAMGAKYLMFVAKHAGGFCWWQTGTTEYSVKNTPWRGGHGDVMADVAKSCKKYGLQLGVYLSPQDIKHGIEVGGKSKDPAKQQAYNNVFRTQLHELLTQYGPIFEVWFDGSLTFDVSDILKHDAPNAIIFQGPEANIRWVGNEEGRAPYPCWNGAVFNPKTWGTLTADDGNPNGDRWLPSECDCRMRSGWFWNSKNADTVKPLDQLMSMYRDSVGHGANMLLNNTPDPSGLIPAPDVARAKEFGAEVQREFGIPIVYSQGKGDLTEAIPSSPRTIDTAVSEEDIAGGERVRSYLIEGLVDDKWIELAKGTAIGHKKIDTFEPQRVSKVRLRVTSSVGVPTIKRLALFRTQIQ